jgi:hypothetical protein
MALGDAPARARGCSSQLNSPAPDNNFGRALDGVPLVGKVSLRLPACQEFVSNRAKRNNELVTLWTLARQNCD